MLNSCDLNIRYTSRECALLKAESACVQSQATCIKATTMFASQSTCNSLLPSNVRHISEPDIKHGYKNCELIGKGTFAMMRMGDGCCEGVINSCQQTLSTSHYFTLRLGFFQSYVIIFRGCMHSVIPQMSAIIMTFHPYNQEHNRSLNIFDALYCAQQDRDVSVTVCDWKQVLLDP